MAKMWVIFPWRPRAVCSSGRNTYTVLPMLRSGLLIPITVRLSATVLGGSDGVSLSTLIVEPRASPYFVVRVFPTTAEPGERGAVPVMLKVE